MGAASEASGFLVVSISIAFTLVNFGNGVLFPSIVRSATVVNRKVQDQIRHHIFAAVGTVNATVYHNLNIYTSYFFYFLSCVNELLKERTIRVVLFVAIHSSASLFQPLCKIELSYAKISQSESIFPIKNNVCSWV